MHVLLPVASKIRTAGTFLSPQPSNFVLMDPVQMCRSRFSKSLSVWQWWLDEEGVIVQRETGSSVSGKQSRN